MNDLIGLLEQLHIHPHRSLNNHYKGPVTRQVKGSSDDFLQLKSYEIGDRLNQVDWKRFVKSKALYTKEFGDEQNFELIIAIDTSRSMHSDTYSKRNYQERLAKSLAYSALYKGHPVTLLDMGSESFLPLPSDSKVAMASSDLWLKNRDYSYTTLKINPSFYEPFKSVLFICLSDCWTIDIEPFIQLQTAMNNDFILLQLLTLEELEPKLSGYCQLVDSESASTINLRVTSELLNQYHLLLQEKTAYLRQACRQYNFRFFQVNVSEPIKPLLIALGR